MEVCQKLAHGTTPIREKNRSENAGANENLYVGGGRGVVLNAVGRRNRQKSANERKRAHMSAKERKRKSALKRAKEHTREQKSTKERKGALPRKNCNNQV